MGKSSKDKRDAYYRLAKEQGWRARSAFKLLQLDDEFNLFEGVTRVVDLCAAPGSWSQVLSRVLIKGERFGRSAWTNKQRCMREVALGISVGDAKEEQEHRNNTEEAAKPDSALAAPRTDIKIVAIDLQPMSPLPGIITLRADITHPTTIPRLLHALDPDIHLSPTSTSTLPTPTAFSNPVDLILSDGAPDVTGLHDLDIYIQSQLLHSALSLSLCILKPNGTFVAKIFRGKDVDVLYAQLALVFDKVTIAKPRSSRASSLEAFVVCQGFRPPKEFKPSLENPNPLKDVKDMNVGIKREHRQPHRKIRADGITELELGSESEEEEGEDARWIAPFLACGDLEAYDADATYHLPADHVSLDPVQPPTAPPYKRALEMRRAAGGACGKTKAQAGLGA